MTNSNNQLLSNPTEWIICGPTSWEDLKNYLPEAKIAGVSVSVILLPPFQSLQVCTDGQYSEPYGNDYILWAQEIAKLSLRYSNLTEFGIYELRENLNLGYLIQDYVNQIMTAGKTINPRLQFITPNKNFYVDRDATGTGDGTTWTNACTSIASVFTKAISAGDTIYVSGGSDSTTYIQDGTKNKISAKTYVSDVVIAPSWESGHNGDVYFVEATSVNSTFWVESSSHIKLTGMNFYTTLTGADGLYGLMIYRSDHITIDNCAIVSSGACEGITISGTAGVGSSYITVNNCTIEVLDNNEPYGQDNILINYGEGYTLTNNIFKHGGYNDAPHNDFIQFVYVGGNGNNLQSIVANNFFYSTAYHAQAGGGVIFVSEAKDGRFLIYNNIIASYQAPAQAGILIAKHLTPTGTVSARIFNNTIISGAPTTYPIQTGLVTGQIIDTLIIKNNIVINDSAQRAMVAIFYGSIRDIDYVDIDYNHYYSNGWTSPLYWIDTTNHNIDWDAWQALGYDANSDTGTVSLANIWGTDIVDYALPSNSPLISAGTDLSAYFTTDILGNARSNWSLGAIEVK